MICVPDAVALPAKLSGRVFCLQPLENTIELLSYGADCPPRPPMMPAETFSGEPTPRLQLIQQSSSIAPRIRNIHYHVPVNGKPSCAQNTKGVLDEKVQLAAIVPLHPILSLIHI